MHPFDRKTSWHDKIDIVVDWMTRSNNSANCVFAYFPELDETAHSYGPWSTEVGLIIHLFVFTINLAINAILIFRFWQKLAKLMI